MKPNVLKTRKVTVVLELDTDLDLRLLKNKWAWRCHGLHVRAEQVGVNVQKPKKARSIPERGEVRTWTKPKEMP